MAKLIIGIHGLANKPEKGILTDYWQSAIAEDLEKNSGISHPAFKFHLVYWADLMYKHQLHEDHAFKFDKLYNDEPYVAADSDALKPYKDSWTDDVRAFAFDIVGSSVDKMKEHFGMDAVADWVLGRALKDLAFYYDPERRIRNRENEQEQASKVLRDELKQDLLANKDKELMLIAHSMGSIIAYDVLRDLGRPGADSGVTIKEFVTIGSPLGLPHVLHKIREERDYDNRVRSPSIVTGGWTNYADRKDPVAADVHLSDDYGANDGGVKVKDDLVLNDYHKPGKPEERNHHKSYGYLRTPEFSDHIRAFLELS